MTVSEKITGMDVVVAELSNFARPSMSIPTFQLTNTIEIEVERRGGSWVRGRWVETPIKDITIKGNLQPVKFLEIVQMPEADRSKEWIKIYTVDHVVTAEESEITGNPADVILWEGNRYKVMREKHYVMGVLDHRYVYCAKEPVSALGED